MEKKNIVIEEIIKKFGLQKEDVEREIKALKRELKGMISEEGAALVIARRFEKGNGQIPKDKGTTPVSKKIKKISERKNQTLFCPKCNYTLKFNEDKQYFCKHCQKLLLFEELAIEMIHKNIHFTQINLPSITVNLLLEDSHYREADKFKLFCKIVDEINLHKNLDELIKLSRYFPKEYNQTVFDPKRNTTVSTVDYRYKAFEYLYYALIKAGNDVRVTPTRYCPHCFVRVTSWSKYCPYCKREFRYFPEPRKRPIMLISEPFPLLMKEFWELNYRFERFELFGYMILGIQGTEVIKKHHSLIELNLERLINDWYKLPENLGVENLSKGALMYYLIEGIKNTDLLEEKVPHFSRLIDLAPPDEFRVPNKHYVVELVLLMEGKTLTEDKYSVLLWVFENVFTVDNFYEFQKDIDLLKCVSNFREILLGGSPNLIKERVMEAISLYSTKLAAMKKKFPNLWRNYRKNFNYLKLLRIFDTNNILLLKYSLFDEFEEFVSQIHRNPTKNLKVIEELLLAIEESGFLSFLKNRIQEDKYIESANEKLPYWYIEIIDKLIRIIEQWKNKDYKTFKSRKDFLDEMRQKGILK